MTAIRAHKGASASSATVSQSTTNACRMCMPLGASLAFSGVEGAVPFLHGSQGCATYIRRYLISHFREPMDIASSSVGEDATVFGGEPNLRQGIANVTTVYKPKVIGVATTCLTETIGEDVGSMLKRATDPDIGLAREFNVEPPILVHAPTPSYAGTHADGYQAAVSSTVATIATAGQTTDAVTLLPGIVSPADIRYLREIADGFGLPTTILPDYSQRLDGVTVARYKKLPEGGTPIDQIRATGHARASVTLGGLTTPGVTIAGQVLATRFGVPHHQVPFPIGIRLTDAFCDLLAQLSGHAMPEWLAGERGRLVDAYIDGHKYVAEKRAVVVGDEDLAVGLSAFLAEIGVTPVVIASGGRSGKLAEQIVACAPELEGRVEVMDDADFTMIQQAAQNAGIDLMVGNSKGYRVARDLGVPLVRVGMPIHDRMGAQRVLHLGFRGAQELFDRIANALLQKQQDESPLAYSYM